MGARTGSRLRGCVNRRSGRGNCDDVEAELLSSVDCNHGEEKDGVREMAWRAALERGEEAVVGSSSGGGKCVLRGKEQR